MSNDVDFPIMSFLFVLHDMLYMSITSRMTQKRIEAFSMSVAAVLGLWFERTSISKISDFISAPKEVSLSSEAVAFGSGMK